MRHLLAILAFTAIFIAVIFVFGSTILPPSNDVAWIEGLYDEKTYVAKNLPKDGPRIFVVGGSDAHFSISAEQIEQATGLPTVNFGTHAQLGAPAHLQLVNRYLRDGDIVVYSGNYYALVDSGPTSILATYMRRHRPFYFTAEPLRDWPGYVGIDVIDQTLRAIANTSGRKSARANAVSTNDFGDETANVVRAGVDYPLTTNRRSSSVPETPQTPPGIVALTRYGRVWEKRGIRLFVHWATVLDRPAFSEPGEVNKMKRFAHYADVWKLVQLNEPYALRLPPEQMFNGPLHPNSIGRQRHTQMLIDGLAPYLASTGATSG